MIKKILLPLLVLCVAMLVTGCGTSRGFDRYEITMEDGTVIMDVTAMSRHRGGQFINQLTTPHIRDTHLGRNIRVAGEFVQRGTSNYIHVWDNCCGVDIRIHYTLGELPQAGADIVIEGIWTRDSNSVIFFFAVSSLTVV